MKNRKPNRLKNYDYSRAGAYFITICTHNKENYFGEINDGIMELNEYGKIAYEMWSGLPKTFKNILLDIFVIMPNHVHGIISITEDLTKNTVGNATEQIEKTKPVGDAYSIIVSSVGNATEQLSREKGSSFSGTKNQGFQINAELHSLQDPGYKRTKMYLSKIIQAYKAEVTRRIKRISKGKIKSSIWQKSFYDRIIRNEKEFYNIQQYIFENPVRWAFDKENNDIIITDTDYYNKIFGTF